MRKKGIFFSSDALIALAIVFITLILFSGMVIYPSKESKTSSDLMKIFSELKVGEIDNNYVKSLINEGLIENTENTIIEQLGEFYIKNETLAKNMAQEIFSDIDLNENIGIWYEEDLIYSINSTPIEDSENIEVQRQIISGLKKGESVTGFSSRAYLENNLRTRYFYFGGYVGDGNISVNIEYEGDIDNIKLEITSNEDFSVYINGNFSGHFQNSSSDKTPAIYDLSAYSDNFVSGSNIIKLIGENQRLYISGGYLRITFENATITETNQEKKYYFSGIEGLINIYDGFFIPNQLESMNILLHYDSEHDIFLNIGNTTVYNGSSEGEIYVNITNEELLEKLDYSLLTNKTIPLRLGMYNMSYLIGDYRNVDVVSVVDLSGSMSDCTEEYTCSYSCFWGGSRSCQTTGSCSSNPCGGLFCSGHSETCPNSNTLMDSAKEGTHLLIDSIFGIQGNKVGLVGYRGSVSDSDSHDISDDNSSLKNLVDSWQENGWTCICCGIEKAIEYFSGLEYDSRRMKNMIVMSDGEANYDCEGNYGIANAKQSAIDIACYAYEEYNITVHSIGFGQDAEEETLIQISNCGNGNYYFADLNELVEIYGQISEEILEASYTEQTIEATQELSVKLFPDSYIKFNYLSPTTPYGLILTGEEKFYNSYEGNFSIPDNSEILDAKAVSYSGSKWTTRVNINNNTIYNLQEYGSDYIDLGDPYVIELPKDYIDNNNSVRITTGLSPANETEGSEYNKIIYRVIKNFVSYSPITSVSEGCLWEIEFEGGEIRTINVPQNYNGENRCYYTEENIEYNENDASQIAVYLLLIEADFDLNGKVDVNFLENDLVISSSEVVGIPYTWGTEVQIRKWD